MDLTSIHQNLAAAKQERRTLTPSQAPDVKKAVRAGKLDLDTEITLSVGGGMFVFRPRDCLRSEQGPDGELVTFHKRSTSLVALMPHFSAGDWKLAHRITHRVAFGDLAAALNDLLASGASFDTRRDPELAAEARQRVTTSNGALRLIQDGTAAAIVDSAAATAEPLASLLTDLTLP